MLEYLKNNKIGIGVDLEQISRFSQIPQDNDRFFGKIFTESEIEYCISKHNPAQHFAARFVGKEAIVKALSDLEIPPLNYTDIEIINSPNGIPKVLLKSPNYSNIQINISLTHSNDMAMGFAVARTFNNDD